MNLDETQVLEYSQVWGEFDTQVKRTKTVRIKRVETVPAGRKCDGCETNEGFWWSNTIPLAYCNDCGTKLGIF